MLKMVGLIPARKESKRVPNKNILPIAGCPLIHWTIDRALASDLDHVYVSTNYDDIGYKDTEGLTFIRRPDAICGDNSPATEYISHFIEYTGLKHADNVCLLQPTCPLRTALDINGAVEAYYRSDQFCLVSAFSIAKGLVYNDKGRSLFDSTWYNKNDRLYVRNSSIYIFNVGYFLQNGGIFSNPTATYEMPLSRSIDINTMLEFEDCEKMLK